MINIDRKIAEDIANAHTLSIAKLGLRFDKVVVRLLGNLRTFAEETAPENKTVLLTVTAPIKLPGKTGNELIKAIKDLFDSEQHDRTLTVFQNKVRIKMIETSLKQDYKFIGFVHNPGTDSKWLIDLAIQWLHKT